MGLCKQFFFLAICINSYVPDVGASCATAAGLPCATMTAPSPHEGSTFYLASPQQVLVGNRHFGYARLPSPISHTSVTLDWTGPGVKVTAPANVSLTLFINYMHLYEQISILPHTMLGNHYIVTPAQTDGYVMSSKLVMVGTADDTKVMVTYLADFRQNSFNLHDLQSKEIDLIYDRSAARIITSKPVAVFLYTFHENCTFVCRRFQQKMLANQQIPTVQYGHTFIIPEVPLRRYIKIVITSVDSWPSVVVMHAKSECNQTLKSELVQEYTCQSQLLFIETDIRATIVIYTASMETKDSFMVNIPDVTKYRTSYTFSLPEPLTYLDFKAVNTTLLVVHEGQDLSLHMRNVSGDRARVLVPTYEDVILPSCESKFRYIRHVTYIIQSTGTFELYEENGIPFGVLLHYADDKQDSSEFGYWLGYDGANRRQFNTNCDTNTPRHTTVTKHNTMSTSPMAHTSGRTSYSTSATTKSTRSTSTIISPTTVITRKTSLSTSHTTDTTGSTSTTTKDILSERMTAGMVTTQARLKSQSKPPTTTPMTSPTKGTTQIAGTTDKQCTCEELEPKNENGMWKIIAIVMSSTLILTWSCYCICECKYKRHPWKKERIEPGGEFPPSPSVTRMNSRVSVTNRPLHETGIGGVFMYMGDMRRFEHALPNLSDDDDDTPELTYRTRPALTYNEDLELSVA